MNVRANVGCREVLVDITCDGWYYFVVTAVVVLCYRVVTEALNLQNNGLTSYVFLCYTELDIDASDQRSCIPFCPQTRVGI